MKKTLILSACILTGCVTSKLPQGFDNEVAVTHKLKNSLGEIISYVQITDDYAISYKHGADIIKYNRFKMVKHPTCDLVVFAHKGKAHVSFGDIDKKMNLVARYPKTRTRAWTVDPVTYKNRVIVPGEDCPFYEVGIGKIREGNSGSGIWNQSGELAGMALGKVTIHMQLEKPYTRYYISPNLQIL